ncbi:flagellar protein FliT [Thermomicrobiaceae bacterium CFH 74404]|uniref:Flagellar protein FliT n=1 Tax=Thermalbibacter longus TaxID=2951981 RepID=A0AA41WG20_9BACT|nr:flagellar protein FliT [Thermalbibacter longus]MCM8749725.1 flagellar protein FliT [Thermalbibacter longus]
MFRSKITMAQAALDLARHLLSLAEEQHAAAQAGDWIRALECADHRATLVAAIGRLDFATLDSAERDTLVDLLARVQAYDEEIARLVKQARRATLAALSELDRGQAMAHGYRRSNPVETRAALFDEEV